MATLISSTILPPLRNEKRGILSICLVFEFREEYSTDVEFAILLAKTNIIFPPNASYPFGILSAVLYLGGALEVAADSSKLSQKTNQINRITKVRFLK